MSKFLKFKFFLGEPLRCGLSMADFWHTMCKHNCAMEIIHRTSAFESLVILVLWAYERDFPCVQNHCIEATLSNNQDNVYISRGRVWNRIHINVRKGRGNEWMGRSHEKKQVDYWCLQITSLCKKAQGVLPVRCRIFLSLKVDGQTWLLLLIDQSYLHWN